MGREGHPAFPEPQEALFCGSVPGQDRVWGCRPQPPIPPLERAKARQKPPPPQATHAAVHRQ